MRHTEDEDYSYVVIVEAKESKNDLDFIVTKHGERFIVAKDTYGITGYVYEGKIPTDAQTFNSYQEAEKFASKWKGHPWYCEPNGNFEILEVAKEYKKVFNGYKPVN